MTLNPNFVTIGCVTLEESKTFPGLRLLILKLETVTWCSKGDLKG